EFEPAPLIERFRRVRLRRKFEGDASRVSQVYVLSRVTLGADVAITSLMLDAAKQRFPDSEIFFAGPRKNYELFAADSRIRHLPVAYVREGSLATRLGIFPSLREALSDPSAIVIDPDSRLTQLGLLPVCDEENHFFW